MKHCQNCGAQMPDTAGFCPNCGTAGGADSIPPAGETTVLNDIPAFDEKSVSGYAAAQQAYQPTPQQQPAPPYQSMPQQAPPYQQPQGNPYGAPQQPQQAPTYQRISQQAPAYQRPPQNNAYDASQPYAPVAPVLEEQKPNIGFAILSFFVPLLGIILFFTQKKNRPKTAKACLIAACISIAIGLIMSLAAKLIANKVNDEFYNPGFNSPTANYDSGDSDDKNEVLGCVIGEGTVKVWDDGDYKWLMAVVPVTNNSKNDVLLPLSDMDVEDADGNLVEVLSVVGTGPMLVKPGETAYYYEFTSYDGEIRNDLKLIPHINLAKPDDYSYTYLDVVGITATTDDLGIISIKGKVENPTNEVANDVQVFINVFDKNGEFIGRVSAFLDTVNPGEAVGFEETAYGWPNSVDDFASYASTAYIID